MRLIWAAVLAAGVAAPAVEVGTGAQRAEPFVPVGVWYPSGPDRPPADPRRNAAEAGSLWRRDLAAIKAAGFNTISTPVGWAGAEPGRGQYRFDSVAGLLSAAGETGLSVIVQIETGAAPGWLQRRYPDAAVVPEPGRRASFSAGYCMDNPGVRADLGAFIAAAAEAAARHAAFSAIDVWRDPGASTAGSARFCYCAYTQARFREALERKYRTIGALNAAWGTSHPGWAAVHAPANPDRQTPDAVDWRRFFAAKLQEDLKFRADASAPRGARPVASHSGASGRPPADDWLMATVVDRYGTTFPTATADESAHPARVLASLDLTRSAARATNWWVAALHAGAGTDARGRNTGPPAGAELRLQTWAAISRGAGSIAYDDWPALSSGAPAAVADRLHGAGDAAGIIGRNSSLFGPLRPHRGKIALIVDPVSGPRGGDAVTAMYATLFGLNIQADFIHQDEVIAGLAAGYDLVYAANAAALPEPVAEALKGFVLNGGSVLADNRAVSPGAPTPRNSAGGAVDMFADHAAARRGAGATGSVPSVVPSTQIPGDLPVRVTNYGSGRVFLVLDTRQAGKPPGVRQSAEAMLRRVVAAAGLKPEVAIAGSDGLVEARFLESADAMLLVALNYGATPRKVTFTFAPDVPEAIWQNMETGAAVNFVQGADGPAYTRTFGARDVMVLVRGKRLR